MQWVWVVWVRFERYNLVLNNALDYKSIKNLGNCVKWLSQEMAHHNVGLQVAIAKCICPNNKISKSIFLKGKVYLSELQSVFVCIAKCNLG